MSSPRNRRWLWASGVYLAISAASIALIVGRDPTGPADAWDEQLGAWVGLASWLASFVQALGVPRDEPAVA